ncbi:CCA tRNA nucleotidyltransferase [Brevibacillus sp. SYSU BS000544]|uniref:CCA tRNA nucleotidyltransferase n=1 Tax=Brevibacillus sp. SYSU BS000544 TaxID=3416443 RepID=UPI003CE54A8E
MLKQHGISILERLEANGFEAYFVGGCVRDWLLNRPVHDIDICTNAHPSDVGSIFPEHIPTGLKHGTVSVKQGGFIYEVTTFRTESGYSDHRRPDEVNFVSDLREDLARRDFTMNAMAMDRFDKLIDPFYGQIDLENKTIRAVGDPLVRFQEDALRLLRAARFASQLGFSIEPHTREAMSQKAANLQHVAVERIREELNKLVDSEQPANGCQLIVETDLLHAFPDLADVFTASLQENWRLTHLGSIPQKWSFLLFTLGADDQRVNHLGTMLRMSNKERETVDRFVRMLRMIDPAWDQPKEVRWEPLLLEFGWDLCIQLDNILQAYWWNKRDRKSSHSLIEANNRLPIHSLNQLAVNGLDLQAAIDRKAGDWIGRTLRYLFEQVALHGLPNNREDLLRVARKEVSKNEHQASDSEGLS